MEEGLHTDEEELKREIDWILKKNKRTTKKRKAKGSPKIHTEEVVRYTGNPMRKDTASKKKTQLALPIMISGVKTFSKLKSIAQQAAKEDCKYTSYNNVWKLNVVEIDTYRAITDALNKKKVQWHSYKNKASKPIKVMARGLHSSCDEKEIVQDLKEKGLQILEAKNIVKKRKLKMIKVSQLYREGDCRCLCSPFTIMKIFKIFIV